MDGRIRICVLLIATGCARPPSNAEVDGLVARWYCRGAGSGETVHVAHRGETTGTRARCENAAATEMKAEQLPACDASSDSVLAHQRYTLGDDFRVRVWALKCGRGETTPGFEPYRRVEANELALEKRAGEWAVASTSPLR